VDTEHALILSLGTLEQPPQGGTRLARFVVSAVVAPVSRQYFLSFDDVIQNLTVKMYFQRVKYCRFIVIQYGKQR